MSEIKKLTLVDLMKNKEKYQVKDNTVEELYIQRLDASITITKPDTALCVESFELGNNDNQAYKADAFLVYNIVTEPNLKDSALQKEFGCVEPVDIVNELFEPGEITNIAKFGLELAGYANSVDRVKSIKN